MDERTTVLSRALREAMELETALFIDLREQMDHLRDSLQDKKWTAGLGLTQGIERFSRRIEEADAARDTAFIQLREALGLPRETAFSAVLTSVPDADRAGLEESWRNLRMSVVKLKTATSRMRYSAEALADTFNRALEEIFPYRKGRLYSRRGKTTSVSDSLLVDRKL